jgi:hypothetical protein
MTNNITTEILTDEDARQMADYLEELMNRQIQKLRQYELEAAMKTAEESQPISERIIRASVLSRPGFEQQRDRIQKLYQELCLTIASQRQEVQDKLGQIRTGLKALGKYAGK